MNQIDQVNGISLAMRQQSHPKLETPQITFEVRPIGITVKFLIEITIFHDSVCECVNEMCT